MSETLGGFSPFGDYSQIQRLIAVTDEMNKKISQIGTDMALLQRDLNNLQEQFSQHEKRTVGVQPVSWQSATFATVGLVMCVLMVLLMWRLSLGSG